MRDSVIGHMDSSGHHHHQWACCGEACGIDLPSGLDEDQGSDKMALDTHSVTIASCLSDDEEGEVETGVEDAEGVSHSHSGTDLTPGLTSSADMEPPCSCSACAGILELVDDHLDGGHQVRASTLTLRQNHHLVRLDKIDPVKLGSPFPASVTSSALLDNEWARHHSLTQDNDRSCSDWA